MEGSSIDRVKGDLCLELVKLGAGILLQDSRTEGHAAPPAETLLPRTFWGLGSSPEGLGSRSLCDPGAQVHHLYIEDLWNARLFSDGH